MSQVRPVAGRTAAPTTAAAGPAAPRLGLALLVIATAQLMVLLDATIVNVALPHIQHALGLSGSSLEWVVNAYALSFGGLLLLAGRAGDLLGRRNMFIAGAAAVFGRFAGGRVRHLPGVAARGPRRPGAGAATIAAAALALIATTFPEGPPRRATGPQPAVGHSHGGTMKLTIIAATGGVGRELLEQAVAAGHDVTAVVRNPGKLSRPVRTVTADMAAADPAALESAVAGADAVLSGLGPHSNADVGIAAQGTRAIVAAMQAAGVRRIVAVSAAPVSTVPTPSNPSPPRHDPGDGFFMRHVLSHVASARLGKVFADLAQMEDILAGQRPGLDRHPAAPADRQAPHRHLPHRLRPEHPRRPVRPPRRRRPPHAPRRRQPQTIHQAIGIAS